MTCYINPRSGTKLETAKKLGESVPLDPPPSFDDLKQGEFYVIYVDNGPFDALGVLENKWDFISGFADPKDRRPKQLFKTTEEQLAILAEEESLMPSDFERLTGRVLEEERKAGESNPQTPA